VRLADGEYRRAEGTDYWSLTIPTDSLEDGQYELFVRSTDVNGVQGEEISQRFFLDRNLPVIDIESHGNGDLVSGRFQISGLAADANGIGRFWYSLDDGAVWEEGRVPGSARNGEAPFSVAVDSRDLEDGPQILRFRSEDLQGSRAETALLLYVDNTPPVLDIIYPREDAPENGYFMVAGRATDDTGVASLTWAYRGSDPVEIPLAPGNPFWSVMADFVGQRQMELNFLLSDEAGNTTRVQLKRALDAEADLPSVLLSSPSEGGLADRIISGWIEDDDGPGGIIYRIDRDEEQRIDSAVGFSVDPGDLAPGEHRLTIRAFDSFGLEGEDTVVDFAVPADDPEITVDRIAGSESADYVPGLRIRIDEVDRIEGRVVFHSGSGSASWRLPGGEEREIRLSRSDAPGEFLFSIPIAEVLPFGYAPVEILAADALGSEAQITAYLWNDNLSRNLSDFGFLLPTDGPFVAGQRGESYDLRFIGHPLESVEIAGGDGDLQVSDRNGFLSIGSDRPGTFSGMRLQGVTDRGTEFSADLPELTFDFAPPEIEIEGDESGVYSRSPRVSGRVSDDAGRPVLEYRINSGEFAPVNLRPEGDSWSFDVTVDLGGVEGEPVLLQLRARDAGGKAVSAYRSFVPSPTSEETPRAAVWGLVGGGADAVLVSDTGTDGLYIAAALIGIDGSANVSYAIDGSPGGSLRGFPVAEARIPLPEPGSHSLEITADYGDGQQVRSSVRFTVAGDRPMLDRGGFVQLADIVRGEDSVLAFSVPGVQSLARAEYRMDDGEAVSLRPVRGDGGIDLSVPLEDLSYGEHRFAILVEDQYGRQDEFSGAFYLVAERAGRNVDDDPGIYSLGDEGGVYRFYVNGRDLAESGIADDDGAFALDASGNYLTLRAASAVRAAGLSIYAVTVDGDEYRLGPADYSGDAEAPELRVNAPENGEYFSAAIPVDLSAEDNDEFVLEYRIGTGQWRDFPEALPAGGVAGTDGDGAAGEGAAADGAPPAGAEESSDETSAGSALPSIPLDGIPDGPVTLEIQASDPTGNSARVSLFLIKDSVAPAIELILPEAAESVNGDISLIFRSTDRWAPTLDGTFALGEESAVVSAENGFLTVSSDFSPFEQLPETFLLALADGAGNIGEIRPPVNFDPQSDKPVVRIQLPRENALITSDALFSGTVFDDDGISAIAYRLDGQEEQRLEGGGSFEIAVPFAGLTDNEHVLEVVAYDLQGVASDPVILPFRVSRRAPAARLISPVLGSTNRAEITLEGSASDENGIASVYVSLDNGLTYKEAVLVEGEDDLAAADVEDSPSAETPDSEAAADAGEESADPAVPAPVTERSWRYELDSQILVDGTYMVLIKTVDSYGVESLNSSLITVDNTPPTIELSLPNDGGDYTDVLPLQLRLRDELAVRRVRYEVTGISGAAGETAPILSDSLTPRNVLLDELDISSLAPGLYNLSIFAYDDATNERIVSRDFIKRESDLSSVPKLLYPLPGSTSQGPFYIEGRVEGDAIPPSVTIMRNGNAFAVAQTDEQGYFRHPVEAGDIPDGQHRFSAVIDASGQERRASAETVVEYRSTGPWIRIESIRTGQYASQRPWVSGSLGYILEDLPEDEQPTRAELRQFRPESLEYSLDNGRTFSAARAEEQWRFRLETQELTDGQLSILVRVRFANGMSAQDLIHVFVDDTNPQVTVLTPEEGLALNGSLLVSGTAFDANGLSDISVMLRPRSKNSYEVPQFIQGLYIDTHVLGATTWEVGIGLTFFDNNVKLQALYGQAPPGRFNGQVLGFKMLANVFSLPYGFLFGPDWDFLSSSIAVGAAFEYFTMENSSVPDQPGLVLGAIVLQLELVKVELKNAAVFNAYAAYVENQLWFISSDVEGGLAYRMAFGLRINVF
jgi:hypothetical protein